MSNMLAPHHLAPQDAEANSGPGFAAVLRARTSDVHREAERGGFIADLIRGRARLGGYVLYLRNLLPVYDALEKALASSTGQDLPAPVFAPFADRRLRRADALRADLLALAGPDWETAGPVLPEARCYAQTVATAAGDARLVAHAYARYLGDLSGGQILKPLLARTLDLPLQALAFYDFPTIPSLEQHKTAMRNALDDLDPDAAMSDLLVAEAIASFRHNIAVSKAVQAAANEACAGTN